MTIEVIERSLQPNTFDHRNSLHKLPKITNYLRQFFNEDEPFSYDDLLLAIEKNCGTDSRTTRKYERLLKRHGYIKPLSTKRSEWVEAKKYVRVRTKSSTSIREYSVREGFKFYIFGPKAPRSYQSKLKPTSPLTRIDEGYNRRNMCVSHGICKVANGVSKSVGKTSIEAIVGEKKEEESVLHTHICTPTQKHRLKILSSAF